MKNRHGSSPSGLGIRARSTYGGHGDRWWLAARQCLPRLWKAPIAIRGIARFSGRDDFDLDLGLLAFRHARSAHRTAQENAHREACSPLSFLAGLDGDSVRVPVPTKHGDRVDSPTREVGGRLSLLVRPAAGSDPKRTTTHPTAVIGSEPRPFFGEPFPSDPPHVGPVS
jgi:hypothetical protein